MISVYKIKYSRNIEYKIFFNMKNNVFFEEAVFELYIDLNFLLKIELLTQFQASVLLFVLYFVYCYSQGSKKTPVNLTFNLINVANGLTD